MDNIFLVGEYKYWNIFSRFISTQFRILYVQFSVRKCIYVLMLFVMMENFVTSNPWGIFPKNMFVVQYRRFKFHVCFGWEKIVKFSNVNVKAIPKNRTQKIMSFILWIRVFICTIL